MTYFPRLCEVIYELLWILQKIVACYLPDDVICDIAIYADDTNLIYETLWTGTIRGLLTSMLEKLYWFRLPGLITLVLLIRRWMGLLLRKNHLFRCWDWPSLQIWIVALILIIAKIDSKKIGTLIRSMKLLSSGVVLYLYKSTIYSCFEHYCHLWAGTPSLELTDTY